MRLAALLHRVCCRACRTPSDDCSNWGDRLDLSTLERVPTVYGATDGEDG